MMKDIEARVSPRGRVIRWVRQAVERGDLQSGDPIPAERVLAHELGVSRTAVRAALRELQEAGALEKRDGSRARRVAGSLVRRSRGGRKSRLFGTDGIRGQANVYPIVPEVALQLGKAIATVFEASGQGRRRAIIGKDTRLSGYMLETALTSGLVSMGMDVFLVGPVPTPAIAHLTRSIGADVGIMLTASHNPYDDNGIKIFDAGGFKLADALEQKIEDHIVGGGLSSEHIRSDRIGKAHRIDDARGRYIEYAKGSIREYHLDELKIVLDCANGAAYDIAPPIFSELGAEVVETGVTPDGYNINHQCGALHPDHVGRLVQSHGADIGIALDGDADRVIFCDADGHAVDGDCILGMAAIDHKERGVLKDDTLVVTCMSNMGLQASMKNRGVRVVTTDVGDRQVIECMRSHGFTLGGEQCGHLIFMDYATTGDGILAALQVLKLMKQKGASLAELAACMERYPQTQVNLQVKEKRPLDKLVAFQQAIYECEKALGSQGRTLVRYSGTENTLRILVESPDAKATGHWARALATAAQRDFS